MSNQTNSPGCGSHLGVTLALAQLRHSETTAKLELQSNHPTRLYLYKNDRPFRLHPVDVILPLKIDIFYRDTYWRRLATYELATARR